MKVLYSWLNEEYFDKQLPSVEEVADALLFHSFEIEEIDKIGENDAVIDVDVLPNRAHDCLSHRGIAKELSIILGMPFSEKTLEMNYANVDATLEIDVQEKKLCDRYIGRVIKNISVKESPDWLKSRLESLGQRSINALVDATNYVLLDIGQPTHVFDLDRLASTRIVVRKSVGEEVNTLDGNKVELAEADLVIADAEGPLAIAGVKGGKKAEVTKDTVNIVLESAHFDPVTVRKTSRRFGILTDSSKRFENEPTPELAEEATEYLTRLIIDLCGTEETVVEYPVDVNTSKVSERKVLVSDDHVNKLLGTQLTDQEIADIFNRFGWDYTKTGDEFEVNVLSERLDITNAADIVEEIGRIYGYKNIPSVQLPPAPAQSANKEFYYVTKIKQALIEAGFSEVYTQSFRAEGALEMANPVAQDRPYLRDSIDLSREFEVNVRNKDLLGLDEVKIFEIGKVFDKNADEKLVLSLQTEKNLKENPLDEFGVNITDLAIEIELEQVIDKLPEVVSYDELGLNEIEPKQYTPFSVYPCVARDIAVWIPEDVKREELVSLIIEHSGDLLVTEPRLIDEYPKDGRVSYAHRLIFQSPVRTLTDEEVGEIMKNIESTVTEKQWEVR